jgi:hypothetical protein
VLNLQVLHADDLQRISFLTGSARYVVSIISALILMIGYLLHYSFS